MLRKSAATICMGCLILYAALTPGYTYGLHENSTESNREKNDKNISYVLNSLVKNNYYLDEIEKKVIENIEGFAIHEQTDSIEKNEQFCDEKYFLDYDLNMKKFTLIEVGKHVEIWVANDLSYGDGDLRSPDVIVDEQINQIKRHFEDVIYPTFTGKFGEQEFAHGENAWLVRQGYLPDNYYAANESKFMILIDNIKDDQYYNEAQGSMIHGYYWSILKKYIGRDMMMINSKDWQRNLESVYLPTITEAFSQFLEDKEN